MIGFGDANKLFNEKGAFVEAKNNEILDKTLAKFAEHIAKK